MFMHLGNSLSLLPDVTLFSLNGCLNNLLYRWKTISPLKKAVFLISSHLTPSDALLLATELGISKVDYAPLNAAASERSYTENHSFDCLKKWLHTLPGDESLKLCQALISIGRKDIADDEEISVLLRQTNCR